MTPGPVHLWPEHTAQSVLTLTVPAAAAALHFVSGVTDGEPNSLGVCCSCMPFGWLCPPFILALEISAFLLSYFIAVFYFSLAFYLHLLLFVLPSVQQINFAGFFFFSDHKCQWIFMFSSHAALVLVLFGCLNRHTQNQSTPSHFFAFSSFLFLPFMHSSLLPKDKNECGSPQSAERVEGKDTHDFL